MLAEMIKLGSESMALFMPILSVISIMIVIMVIVFFIPGMETDTGRYLVFWWWAFMITLGWNIFYWFFIFHQKWYNFAEWTCAYELDVGT